MGSSVVTALGSPPSAAVALETDAKRRAAQQGLVWAQVQGKTLDNFFDRGGGMSPVLANTLNVKNSPPVRLSGGKLAYIKTDLCRKVMGEALLPLVALHDKVTSHTRPPARRCSLRPVRGRTRRKRELRMEQLCALRRGCMRVQLRMLAALMPGAEAKVDGDAHVSRARCLHT